MLLLLRLFFNNMKNHLLHFFVGGGTGLAALQAVGIQSQEPWYNTLIKSVIALVIGVLSTLFTNWVNKKFPSDNKNSSNDIGS